LRAARGFPGKREDAYLAGMRINALIVLIVTPHKKNELKVRNYHLGHRPANHAILIL